MNQQQIEKLANDFLGKEFGMRLAIPLRISNRMKSTFGVFKFNRKTNKPTEIAMSAEFLKNHSKEKIIDVLYHECVHYALFEQGLPYNDGDKTFKRTVDRLGVSRTGTYQFKGNGYLYQCGGCERKITKRMKGFEKRYVCGECRGKFDYLGQVEVTN